MHGDLRLGSSREQLRAGARSGALTADRLFELVVTGLGLLVVLLMAGIVAILLVNSGPSLRRYGLSFLVTTVWDPVAQQFGALAFIYGTLVTSAVALLIAVPFSVGAALFLAEYAPRWMRGPVAFLIELLAIVPSIIYGLWGFFILAPFLRSVVERPLKQAFGEWPVVGGLFQGPPLGKDLLVGGVILAIMIVPTITAIAREVLLVVPPTQREALIALGATKWETMRWAVLPYARAGIIGAAVLGLARAFGETMAVTMVVGNSSTKITGSLFTPGYTLASAIANQFTEANSEIYFSAIVEIGLVLLAVATIMNLLARLLIWRFAQGAGGSTRL